MMKTFKSILRKRFVFLVFCVFFLSLFLVACGQIEKSQNVQLIEQSIHIGVLLPLTGNFATYGTDAQLGILLALDEVQQHNNKNITLFFEDHQADTKQAVAAYQKLKNINSLDAVITGMSPTSLAIKPLANEDKIIQMAMFSSTPDYSSFNDSSFRITTRAEVEDKALVDYLFQHFHYKTAGILYLQNDMGIGHKNGFSRSFAANGGEIIITESYGAKEIDYRTQLLKIKEKNAAVLFLAGDAKSVGNILKQMKELSFNIPVVSTRAVESEDLLSIAGDAAEGLLYPYPFDLYSTDPIVQQFVLAYQLKYNKDPSTYSVEGYVGAKILFDAFLHCSNNTNVNNHLCVQQELMHLKNYQSVFGVISFDENGDVVYPFLIKKVEQGKFVKAG